MKSHGQWGTPTWKSWRAMIQRCTDANATNYKWYGGRGIKVHESWRGPHGFANFLKDVGERPAGKTLDRLNMDGNYEPGNVTWATQKEQTAHTRRSRRTADGRLLKDVVQETGMHLTTIYDRLKRGWTLERALAVPAWRKGPKPGKGTDVSER